MSHIIPIVCVIHNQLTNTIVILKVSCHPIIVNSKPPSVFNLSLKTDKDPNRGIVGATSSQLT